MRGKPHRLCLAVAVLAAGLALAGLAWADGHKDKQKRHRASPPQNQAHAQACGQCHMIYPPCLLPGASWARMLDGRADHFGESLALGQPEAAQIRAFLVANAADRSGGKRARKIMASLNEAAPLRPSQTPYLLRKHREISEEVFARPSVGGRGNCKACHPGAEQADYDDDRARIPR